MASRSLERIAKTKFSRARCRPYLDCRQVSAQPGLSGLLERHFQASVPFAALMTIGVQIDRLGRHGFIRVTVLIITINWLVTGRDPSYIQYVLVRT
jgi:hypothetical protein